MNLEEYLKTEGISVNDFAGMIRASIGSVYRYMKNGSEHRVPNPEMMLRIVRATHGKVNPNSFYPIPDEYRVRPSTRKAAPVNEKSAP